MSSAGLASTSLPGLDGRTGESKAALVSAACAGSAATTMEVTR